MAITEKKHKKPKKVETTDIEEYLKQLPPPPEEHAYELNMEKRLKRTLGEQEKKKTKNMSKMARLKTLVFNLEPAHCGKTTL